MTCALGVPLSTLERLVRERMTSIFLAETGQRQDGELCFCLDAFG